MTPPSIERLVAELKVLDAASFYPEINRLRDRLQKIVGLVTFLGEVEQEVREEIKSRTTATIGEISEDIQAMWTILHPREPIDGVHIYQFDDAEKSLDVALRFYGREQLSPRLTLSEGHRNSLGLCVFLALARRGSASRPLILDDVVSSFDREHRGFVVDLLTQRFSDRQVIIFTPDYDWYVELRHRLPAKVWRFSVLLPWREPIVGLRWAGHSGGFDLARDILESDPQGAAGKARGMLDTHLAVVAETLQVPVPHIRGPRNDLRFAGDLLERIAAECARKIRRRDGAEHKPWDVPSNLAKSTKALLVPFANPAVHGRYVTKGEAERLIDACEQSISVFTCNECEFPVWHLTTEDHHRCECDSLRWKL
jgi:hypothetical protein